MSEQAFSQIFGTSGNFEELLPDIIEKGKGLGGGKILNTTRIIAFLLMQNMQQDGFVFHNLERTKYLTKFCIDVGKRLSSLDKKSFTGEDSESLLIAASLKDIGFCKPNVEKSPRDYPDALEFSQKYGKQILEALSFDQKRLEELLFIIEYSFNAEKYAGQKKGPVVLRYAEIAHCYSNCFWKMEVSRRKEQESLGVIVDPLNIWFKTLFKDLENAKKFLLILRSGYYIEMSLWNQYSKNLENNIFYLKKKEKDIMSRVINTNRKR